MTTITFDNWRIDAQNGELQAEVNAIQIMLFRLELYDQLTHRKPGSDALKTLMALISLCFTQCSKIFSKLRWHLQECYESHSSFIGGRWLDVEKNAIANDLIRKFWKYNLAFSNLLDNLEKYFLIPVAKL